MPGNNTLNKFSYDDIVDVKQQSLYSRLKRLFATDVIVRNVGGKKLKIKDSDELQYATDRNSFRDRWNRVRSSAVNAYTRDFALSYQSARLDLFRDYDCVGPDTIIPLPDGTYPTISELTEKYKDKPQERFYVFSYDHKTDSIKLGKAYHPRKKEGTREGFKVTFDNGQFVIGSIKHPFLMRNGEYKMILDLNVGDSVMPFYQKNYGYKKHGFKQYRRLYNFSKGWQSEHKIIVEQFQRLLNKNEVIHHKNINGSDNSPENLQIMDWKEHKEHKELHSHHSKNIIWGEKNYDDQLKKLFLNENYINRDFHHWNGKRKGENNPFYGKIHTEESNKKRSKTLKEVFVNRDQTSEKTPNHRDDLTIDVLKIKAADYYKENGKLTSWGLVKNVGCDYSVLQNRLKTSNLNWNTFKNDVISTLNHKIVSIESIGPIDVYDVTVEEFHNFATDSCIVANTMDMDPILSCLSGDTYISTLTGFITIKELAEKYPNGETFQVWSWDKDKQKLTLGSAHHPRKTGTKSVIELHLDNKKIVKCTPDHRIMLIDGTYKEADQLKSGDSLMPFYHSFDKTHGYQKIKSLGKKYKDVHRYIFEDVFEQIVSGDNIHHKNHNKLDNRIENLEWMTALEHCKLHGIYPITTGKRRESCKKLWLNDEYKIQGLSGPKRFQSSDEGKKMMSEPTSLLNKHRWNTDSEYALKMVSIFSKHAKKMWSDPEWKEWKRKKHSETIKLKYANDPIYAEKTKSIGSENGRFNNLITTESILTSGINYETLVEFSNNFNFGDIKFKNDQYKRQFISRRIKTAGYKNWTDYKNNFEYSNHKVLKIVNNNEIIDVYDLTVDVYENFSIEQGIIVSNSCLDIYADECLTENEMGEMLTIDSKNNNIKEILHNLFYDILNIEFNLWSWIRNMAKYGDFYLKLNISPEYGVYLVEPMSAYNVERIENSDPLNKNYVKYQVRPVDTSQAEMLESFQVAHFRLLSDSNFLPYGKCLVFDTHIDTEFGCKYIKDLKIGENIWTFNINTQEMELSKVKNKISSGKKEIIRIRTQHNFIDGSKNHPILTYNDRTYKFEYKIAEDIKIGNLLVVNNNKNKKDINYKINKDISEDKTCKSDKPEIDNIPEYANEEFCEFIGFMLGDGWIRKYTSGGRVAFSLGIDEVQNKYYIEILKKYSNKIPYIAKTGSNTTKSRAAIIYSKYLFEILKNNGFKDVSAKEKRIPEWIFEESEKNRLSFLTGFHNADGWNSEDEWSNHYFIQSCNKDLIYDLKRLVQFSNIKSSIPKSKIYNDIIEICGISCNRSESHEFCYYIDGKEKEQQEKYKFIDTDKFILDVVRKIEYKEEKETWDIQVDSENSNFIANGLVAHNSMIEPARRVWKQLSLLEDAMLIHRIMRAPEKRIFKIDIGNIPPNEVDNFMEKIISKMKKIPYIDEHTGDYNLRFNLMNMTEDFFLPVRGTDSGASIDTLPGMEFTGIDDLEYVKNKMMAALKIPKAFLGFDENLGGKATLAAEDVRFARTIGRIQKMVISELNKIAQIHLFAQGYRDSSMVDFTIGLTNPSTVFEKEKMDIWAAKLENAKSMWEMGDSSGPFFARNFVYKKIFKMSDDDIQKNEQNIVEDCKQLWRMKQITDDGNDPAKPFKKINPKTESGDENPDDSGGPLGSPAPGGELSGPETPSGGEEKKGPSGGNSEPSNIKEETLISKPIIQQKQANWEWVEESEEKIEEKHGEPGPNYVRPSQAGEKDASDYPRGEDPLGDKENNRKSRPESGLSSRISKSNKIELEMKGVIKNLSSFLSSNKSEKKELVKESTGKSLLDEKNIIE